MKKYIENIKPIMKESICMFPIAWNSKMNKTDLGFHRSGLSLPLRGRIEVINDGE